MRLFAVLLCLLLAKCGDCLVSDVTEIAVVFGGKTFHVHPNSGPNPFPDGVVTLFTSKTGFPLNGNITATCLDSFGNATCNYYVEQPTATEGDSVVLAPVFSPSIVIEASAKNVAPTFDQLSITTPATCAEGYQCVKISAHALSISYERCLEGSPYAESLPCAYFGASCAYNMSDAFVCNHDAVPVLDVNWADIVYVIEGDDFTRLACDVNSTLITSTHTNDSVTIRYRRDRFLALSGLSNADSVYMSFNVFARTPMYQGQMHIINAQVHVPVNKFTGAIQIALSSVILPPWLKDSQMTEQLDSVENAPRFTYSSSAVTTTASPPFSDTTSLQYAMIDRDLRFFLSGAENNTCVYNNSLLTMSSVCDTLFTSKYFGTTSSSNGKMEFDLTASPEDVNAFYLMKGDFNDTVCFFQMSLFSSDPRALATTVFNRTVVRPLAHACLEGEDIKLTGKSICGESYCVYNHSATAFNSTMVVESNGDIQNGLKIMVQTLWRKVQLEYDYYIDTYEDNGSRCSTTQTLNNAMECLATSAGASRWNGSETTPTHFNATGSHYCATHSSGFDGSAYYMDSGYPYTDDYCVRPAIDVSCDYCGIAWFSVDYNTFTYTFPTCDNLPCHAATRHDLHIYSLDIGKVCAAAENEDISYDDNVSLTIIYNVTSSDPHAGAFFKRDPHTPVHPDNGLGKDSGGTPVYVVRSVNVPLDITPCDICESEACTRKRNEPTYRRGFTDILQNIYELVTDASNSTYVDGFSSFMRRDAGNDLRPYNPKKSIRFDTSTIHRRSGETNQDVYYQPFVHVLGGVVMSGVSPSDLRTWINAGLGSLPGLIHLTFPNITNNDLQQIIQGITNLFDRLGTPQAGDDSAHVMLGVNGIVVIGVFAMVILFVITASPIWEYFKYKEPTQRRSSISESKSLTGRQTSGYMQLRPIKKTA